MQHTMRFETTLPPVGNGNIELPASFTRNKKKLNLVIKIEKM